jgi:mannose/cellobiose epimerase-like protein (N-acyl-D-glucosamine 2-epimerase family)
MSDYIDRTLDDIAAESNKWLRESAVPLWYERGIDWNRGGFYEYINLQDLNCFAKYKRVRVLSRQIYVFSTACRLGDCYTKPAVFRGLEFLLDKFRLKSGGFASRTTLDGEIIEGPLDLYDLSFCLYALAHGYKLLRDSRLKDEALILTEFILDRFRHVSGGYIECLPASLPRRQNPHMHFLEALLEWRELSDNKLFCDMSDEIIRLFFNKFYFSDTGALVEYFDNDLIPVPGQRGAVTEPGHHFEWEWLLNRYSFISGHKLQTYTKLYQFAHQYGINQSNQLLWGEVTRAGQPINASVRIWPHTEWIKAELARYDETNLSQRVSKAWRALSRFLDCSTRGLWHEIFDHERNMFLDVPAPASSLYHIVLAIEALNTHLKTSKKHYDNS